MAPSAVTRRKSSPEPRDRGRHALSALIQKRAASLATAVTLGSLTRFPGAFLCGSCRDFCGSVNGFVVGGILDDRLLVVVTHVDHRADAYRPR